MRCSAYGRRRLALASVVVIRPCSNSCVARLASMSRSCAGLPPMRGPLLGVGMSFSSQVRERVLRGGASAVAGALPFKRGVLQLLGLGEARVAAVVAEPGVGRGDGRR